MKEMVTPLEASKHGLVKGMKSYLPEGFEMDGEIASYRFWLMAKMNNPTSEALIRRHDWFINDFRKRLLTAYPNKLVAERNVTKLVKGAYYSIPFEFWENIERRAAN